MADTPPIDAADLVGLGEAGLADRFGPPATRRGAGREVWLVYDLGGVRLRLRLAVPSEAPVGTDPVVASWIATFAAGHATLREAAEALGLWPQAAPDARADAEGPPLVRRPVHGSDGRTHSLTATVRAGRFTHLSVFDEPPEWL